MHISIQDLRYQISPKQWLQIDNWLLNEGQSALIAGPNNSGKSTFAGLLSQQLRPSNGKIKFSHPEKLAYVSFELEAEILAEDRYHDDSEFVEGGLDQGRSAREIIGPGKNQNSIIDLIGISNLMDRPFKVLSTGETRKVLIARALMGTPELLILEEPFSGLDISSRKEMIDLFGQLIDQGVQILLFDFFDTELPAQIDHMIFMYEGKIALEGSKKTVIESSKWKSKNQHQIQLPHHLPDSYRYDHLNSSCPFVKIVDLEVHYHGKPVFKKLNWTFNRGENWRITGPNGSGKSTLLGMISGDNPKAYGKDITLFGVKRGSGESIWDIKRHYGILSSSLHRDYKAAVTVLEAVASGFFDSIGLYDKPSDSQWKIAREWLELLGIQEKEKMPFSRLSYGEQRQVLIVRAMVKLPLILLLDEPCIGLDNRSRSQVLALIDYIAVHSQTHILFVAHDYNDELTCLNRSLNFEPHTDCYTTTISNI